MNDLPSCPQKKFFKLILRAETFLVDIHLDFFWIIDRLEDQVELLACRCSNLVRGEVTRGYDLERNRNREAKRKSGILTVGKEWDKNVGM